MNQVKKDKITAFLQKAIRFSIYAYVFFLPFSISGAQTALVAMLVFQVACWIALRKFDWKFDPLAIPLLLFLVATAISSVYSLDPLLSIRKSAEHYWIIAAYFLLVNQLRGKDAFVLRLLKILVVVAGVVAIYAHLQHLWGFDFLRVGGNDPRLYQEHGDYYHAVGFFDHHLTYGNSVMMTLFAGIGLLFMPVARKWKITAGVALFLTLSAFFFSYARGPLLGFVLGCVLFGYIRGRRYLIATLAICIVLGAVFYSASPTLRDRIDSSFTSNKNVERIITWQTSVDLIKDYPWLGVGTGVYRNIIMNYRTGYNVSFTSRSHAHNLYLHLASTQGLIGLLPLLWIFVRLFAVGIERYYSMEQNKNEIARESLLLSIAALAAFCFAGLFQNNFQDGEVALLLWFFAAAIMRKPESMTRKGTSVL